MKVTNVLKNVGVGVLVTMLVGCASMDGMAKMQATSQKNGSIYGINALFGAFKPSNDIKALCKAISNKDSRCAEPDKYGSIAVLGRAGFSDGFMGAVAVYEKQAMTPDAGCSSFRTEAAANKACTFYKVSVEPGKLATVVSIASSPTQNTGNCTWSGTNGWGGTVCSTYNWDWRKDGGALVAFQW